MRLCVGDVLLVSDAAHMTESTVEALRTALAMDSACASVSLDESAAPRIAGLPPPAVERPHRGVVLVSRDHLHLALDEIGILGAEEVGLLDRSPGRGLADDLIASLVRPGFVHRATRVDGEILDAQRSASLRRTRRPPAQIVIDGRCLANRLSGTQVHLVNLLGGLVRSGTSVAVLAPDEVHPTTEEALGELPEAPPFVEREHVGRPEIFHRPFQIGSLAGLRDCLSIGQRLVVTHQDMIAARTTAYAADRASWYAFCAATAATLASADEVGFFSRHAALDAASSGEVDLTRATVVRLGVDHLRHVAPVADPARPLGGRPYLFLPGNAYWHKNRVFAMRLFQALVERHGWDGGLVLAGDHPRPGSSVPAEEELIRRAPSLAPRIADLHHVSQADHTALFFGADVVLAPSLYEGFGLVPFEAAALGKACVYTHRSSLEELLPTTGALPSFDLDDASQFVLHVLESDNAREAVVTDITEAAAELTWDRTAAGYLDLYARALEREPRGVSRVLVEPPDRRLSEMEALVLDVYRRRRGFRLAVDATIRTGALIRRMLLRR